MAAGYDLSSKNPFRLMQGRLGVYEKKPFNPNTSVTSGIEEQSIRLKQMGGNLQQDRMILDKRKTLDRAVWSSYQAAEIILDKSEIKKPVRALINPNKLKQDYDDKIISIGYEYNLQCGDIFEWVGTKTHWIVYLQDLTELAYFRGDIRKCSYEISWKDDEKEYSTYAAIRGPVETKIDYIQKHGISVDNPNYSLNILLPKNEDTLKYFQRYSKFYLQQDLENAPNICWRVEAIDWISIPGVLEINAVEYYSNDMEDDLESGLVGGLIIKDKPNIDTIEELIAGDTFIKPKAEYEFIFTGDLNADWNVDSKYPVSCRIDPRNSKKVYIKWNQSYSGQFELYYGDIKKTIIVESLF